MAACAVEFPQAVTVTHLSFLSVFDFPSLRSQWAGGFLWFGGFRRAFTAASFVSGRPFGA
jgi:hypothetical protein